MQILKGNREVVREIDHYNLQAIIAVGFKVNNERAVQFRKWANQIVKDYTIQGWTMDVDRLKKGHMFTDEYFERQFQYIREIRLSERKFYQKVTDIYATSLILIDLWKLFKFLTEAQRHREKRKEKREKREKIAESSGLGGFRLIGK